MKRRANRQKVYKQASIGHLLGDRRAILLTPCCSRRIRVLIQRTGKRSWKHETVKRCPGCRLYWKVELIIGRHGFARIGKLRCNRFDDTKRRLQALIQLIVELS